MQFGYWIEHCDRIVDCFRILEYAPHLARDRRTIYAQLWYKCVNARCVDRNCANLIHIEWYT